MPDSTVYRKPLISGNWKMHNNHFEAIQSLQKLAYLLTKDDYSAVDVSIHPPFTDIRSVQTLIDADDLRIHLGAQNCHWEEKGAFTGEVAAAFLAKLGVQYVIVGHSERREIFGETDADVSKKITTVQKLNMFPIICVGETLESVKLVKQQRKLLVRCVQHLLGARLTKCATWLSLTNRFGLSEQVAQQRLVMHRLLSGQFELRCKRYRVKKLQAPFACSTAEA